MTTQELEQQLLNLDIDKRIHILQVLANSLTVTPPVKKPQNLADFFRNSPLVEAMSSGELDLSRDQTLEADRFIL
jgi:hypothetical protein